MEFPKVGLSQAEVAKSPFCCGCRGCGGQHSVIERKDGAGLRLVGRKGYFKAMGIPDLKNTIRAAAFLAGSAAKVQWADGFEYAEAA